MLYTQLPETDRAALWSSLEEMPSYLQAAFGSLTPEKASHPGPSGSFSPVEQVWHLADLEREGFGERIRRLRSESNPELPDFDGTKVAIERNYRTLSLAEGLAIFAEARVNNISMLISLEPNEWAKTGSQEGIGAVSLCDIPVFIAQHDAAHKQEIESWKAHAAG